ncbi:MAG: methyltransferase [Acidobacteriota bacterium]
MTFYDREKISLDYFYKNKVKIFQHKKGYRFSVDSPILADFIPASGESGLEVGSGSGVISLLLLYLKKFPFITGIEIQKNLFDLTKMSIAENSLQSQFEVINDDFIEVSSEFRGIMNIFSNPPYLKTGIGHLSNNEEMRRGKFEIDIDLERLLKGCSSILGEGGNIFLVFPFERYEEMTGIAGKLGLYPVKLRKVLSFANGKPERFLIQLTNSKGDLEEVSPLIIYHSVGVYSDEMELILAGR